MLTRDPHQELVNLAFSRQSVRYDAYEEDHEILKRMRSQVRAHAMRLLKKGDHILELNSGTGLDAVFFASHGFKVHATDLSDGMISQLRHKVEKSKLQDRITIQQCSVTSLGELGLHQYDYVFSNFGGLNCISSLSVVASSMRQLLKPGGFVTMVIMPPVCPWELVMVLGGHIKTAVRRLHRNGVVAHMEDVYFRTYYFTPRQVLQTFGNGFKKVCLQGLASLGPPPHMERFPTRYPRFYRFLCALDEHVVGFPPFNSWADHFILTLQYCR